MAGPARGEILRLGSLSNAQEIAQITRGRAVVDYTTRRPRSEVMWPNGNSLFILGDELEAIKCNLPPSAESEERVTLIDLAGASVTAVGRSTIFIGKTGRYPSESGGFIIGRDGKISRVPSEDAMMS